MSELLKRYYELKFFIIAIKKNDKRPLWKHWNEYSLSYLEAEQFLKEGYNIGVVAKDLWIFDYDQPLHEIENRRYNIPFYRAFETPVQFTPSGYHVFYRAKPTDSNIGHLAEYKKEHKIVDTIRHGDMYAVLAPSKVNGHSYFWLDSMKGEIKEI